VPDANGNGNGNGHDCKSLATFIVDYQTYPNDAGKQQFKTLVMQMDVETDTAVSVEWLSLEQYKPCEWMQLRLEETLANYGISPLLPAVVPVPESDAPPTPNTRILAYRICWDSGSLNMELPFGEEKWVMLEQPSAFDLDIHFTVEGMASNGNGLDYHAACHIIPMGSQRETTCFQGDKQRHLGAGKTTGTAHLQALHLPAGHYEAWLSVKPDAVGSRPDLVKGPRIMVMEGT
jgi:hypothetical protein